MFPENLRYFFLLVVAYNKALIALSGLNKYIFEKRTCD